VPRASGPVPFELGFCAGHVEQKCLKTKDWGKVKGESRKKIRRFEDERPGKVKGESRRFRTTAEMLEDERPGKSQGRVKEKDKAVQNDRLRKIAWGIDFRAGSKRTWGAKD